MIRVSQGESGSRYDIRLSGSLVNVLIVGIVSFLRDRRVLRALTGGLGTFTFFIGIFFFLFHPYTAFGDQLGRLSTPMIAAGFALLMSAILSGGRFNLYLGEPPEVEERREAEEEIGDSRDPYAWLDLDSKRLNEYYAINQSQARGSFRWAVFAMFCGLATIVSGIWLFYFRTESPDKFLTSLSTAAGVVINIVSGLFLYLHNKTQRRSLYYYGQLVRVQQLGLVIRLAESHDKPEDRAEAKNKVISEVLGIVRLSAELDTKEAAKEAA